MAAIERTAGESLYLAEAKVYPREVQGRFARLRTLSVWVLLGIFYLLPWLQWHGRQAVLFDLPARKFFIVGLVFWPQDFIFLTWLLIIAALALFFFTAIGGRLWCGYACPQTVWTETFLWMERFVEGDRAARVKLDKAPWSARKLGRKSLKQLLWITFALWTGFTFVGFFTPIRLLAGEVLALAPGPWETFWILFYGFATYGNAGYLREQVCKYMCPYARFQGAMFDRDTLVITYDEQRGETRGSRKRGTDARLVGLGDCIDCTMCVQVCPTGIDIRQGLQIECIACAACVDACDEVMDKVDQPRGLIRYTSETRDAGGRTHWLRPRTLAYGAIWLALCGGFVAAVLLRNPLQFDVIRDRHSLFRQLPDGAIENVYLLKVANPDDRAHAFELDVTAPGGAELDVEPDEFQLAAGEARAITVAVRTDRDARLGAVTALRFALHAEDAPGLMRTRTASFLAAGAP